MPELAEVEYMRKRWNPGLGHRIERIRLHPDARVFRGISARALQRQLTGECLLDSEASGKQMCFRASGDLWLGIHLGMTGSLDIKPPGHRPAGHDHLVLDQEDRCLVFSDPRMFGRILFSVGSETPVWWRDLPPAVLSKQFTRAAVAAFLQRRARSPIKSVLLMQERFPGIGNWMADEILWRAGIHPERPAGSLSQAEIGTLHRETRWVADRALRTIGETYADPPRSWLFSHRWQEGGTCPRTGVALSRRQIGGRTTCWSPARQPLRPR